MIKIMLTITEIMLMILIMMDNGNTHDEQAPKFRSLFPRRGLREALHLSLHFNLERDFQWFPSIRPHLGILSLFLSSTNTIEPVRQTMLSITTAWRPAQQGAGSCLCFCFDFYFFVSLFVSARHLDSSQAWTAREARLLSPALRHQYHYLGH